MTQTTEPAGEQDAGGPATREEACHYIFDLLESLESIAARHRLSVLARLIASAKSEASEYL